MKRTRRSRDAPRDARPRQEPIALVAVGATKLDREQGECAGARDGVEVIELELGDFSSLKASAAVLFTSSASASPPAIVPMKSDEVRPP